MTPDTAALVLARVQAVADPRARVELYGSSVYAPAYAGDVDVLVTDDNPGRLALALDFTLLPTVPRRLHGTLEGVPVDITVITGDDEPSRRMRSGPRDAMHLAAQLRTHEREAAFEAAWPHVRQFARLRALGNNGLGWFGSFGWALLLAIPLCVDPELRAVAPGAVLPAWFRWLANLTSGTRVDFDGLRRGEHSAFFLAAPSPPLRDVAKLTKRAATWLFAEGRAAMLATKGTTTDADAIARITDLSDTPPPGVTLVIGGDDEHGRGRYDGTARGLIRELEAVGAVRSWGRFDVDDDGGWQHRITVPIARLDAAHTIIENWLQLTRIDASAR